jgi:DNA-binding NarL/FixJ family response regulator
LLAEQDTEPRCRADVAHTPTVEAQPLGPTGRTVAIADDDLLLREGLASLLTQAGYSVVGQAGDATELLDLVREHRPELAIVDIRMPPDHATEGLRAAEAIREEMPETAILVLSAYVEIKHATTLLASGQRCGYLLKSRVANIEEFLESIDRLSRGGSVIDPSLVVELLAARTADDPLEGLTPREHDVLGLMAEGRTNAGIARRLWVTEGTVEKHVHSIFGKLRLPETDDDHRRVLAVIAFLATR